MNKENIKQLIKALGGTNKTAQLCDVQPCAVSKWLVREAIPASQLKYLRLKKAKVFKDLGL